MDLTPITEALQRDAVWVVFVNVLLQQIGLPVPAVPTLLVAGSLAASPAQAGQMLAAAVLASVLADGVWYQAGRAFGYRVLSGLCKLSINPGSCVSETEGRFIRWGAWSLVVAKFVPGFSTVAPPIAGSLRMPLPRFIAAAGLGAALWAGAAILAGWWLRAEVQAALETMSRHGGTAIAVAAIALGAWLLWKIGQKYRFEQLAAIPHITPAELMKNMASEKPPLLLDFRGEALIAQEGPIALATPAHLDDLPRVVSAWPKDHDIVTLCACPQDATAVRAARVLMKRGYTRVRPLKGGYDAWMRQLKGHEHGSG
ncbi:VTT domain-containing protein [Polaromonas glacialis]|uniref:VTT domain-containing protein n=1 Tax=Polaromonas glacialis TaxID=866564 RepID=UPI00069104EC|nr:VTT domain-containing protein [Polaromonas glacialis]